MCLVRLLRLVDLRLPRRLGRGALAAALLASCSGLGEWTATTSSAIQGGTDDATHAFAVGVYVQLGGGEGAVCSGALLAPNLVATARHCVAVPADTTIDCATSTFGPQVAPTAVGVTTAETFDPTHPDWQTLVGVSRIVTPEGQTLCGNDLALLVLQRSIGLPAYVEPIIAPPMTNHQVWSTQVTEIGYGLDAPDAGDSAGTRRVRQDVPLVCIPNDGSFANCFDDPALRSTMSANEFESGEGTCEGDSGSGAFDQKSFDAGRWASFGVLSRGSTACDVAVYTRFDAWGALLVQTAEAAAQAGGYPVPAWATSNPAPVGGAASGGSGSGHGGSQGGCSTAAGSSTAVPMFGGAVLAAALVRRRRRPKGSDRP